MSFRLLILPFHPLNLRNTCSVLVRWEIILDLCSLDISDFLSRAKDQYRFCGILLKIQLLEKSRKLVKIFFTMRARQHSDFIINLKLVYTNGTCVLWDGLTPFENW
jgi:hypothetical protein